VIVVYLRILSQNLPVSSEKAVRIPLRTPAVLGTETGDWDSPIKKRTVPHPTCPAQLLGILKDGILERRKEKSEGGTKRCYI
jgi:hypothetical protein